MKCQAKILGVLVAGMMLSLSIAPARGQEPEPGPDWADVAPAVAAQGAAAVRERIDQRFAANPNAKPFRVAVFPFGDATGKITQQNHDNLFQAQGAYTQALGSELAKVAKGKFLILDKFAVSREFRDSGIDPASVSAENPELPVALEKLSIDVAILASVAYSDGGTPLVYDDDGHRIKPTLVFAGKAGGDSIISTPPSQPLSVDSPVSTQVLNTRILIELWHKQGNSAKLIPIVSTQNEGNGEQVNVWYAVIPAASEGTEYVVRLVNRGMSRDPEAFNFYPIGNQDESLEARRLFGIVLTVDGVNSFYEDLGDGVRKPVIVHPRNASKWILGPPGHRIVPASNPSGYSLVREQGTGHSIIDVLGFKTDDQNSRAFTFGPASQSIAAEKVGISDEIGIISAYVFGEKLPGDGPVAAVPQGTPRMGTSAGRQVHQPVFRINPKFHKEPFATFKIFYRSSDEIPIPRQERVQIAGGN
jgi:hypothetical protein